MNVTQLEQSKKYRLAFVEKSNELLHLHMDLQQAQSYQDLIPFIDQQIESMSMDILFNIKENENPLGLDLTENLKQTVVQTNKELDIIESVSLSTSNYNDKFQSFYEDINIAQGYFYAKEYNNYADLVGSKSLEYNENQEALRNSFNINPSSMEGFFIEAHASINALAAISKEHNKPIDVFNTLDSSLEKAYQNAVKDHILNQFYEAIGDTKTLIVENKVLIEDSVSKDTLDNLSLCEEKCGIILKEKEKEKDDLAL